MKNEETCPICYSADNELAKGPMNYVDPVTGKRIVVDVEYYICNECENDWMSQEQFRLFQDAIAEKKKEYDSAG